MARYVDAARSLNITTEVLYKDSISFGKTENEHCQSVRPIIILNPDSNIVSGDGKTMEISFNIK